MRRYPETIQFRFVGSRYFKIVKTNTELIARNMGFSEDKIIELSLAVEEAYVNAVEHSGNSAELNLEVEFQVFADRLEISVKDSGCGFDITRLKIPKSLKNLDGVRGRGLSIIRQFSDRLVLDSIPGSGTLIRIIKFLSRRKTRNKCLVGRSV